LKRTKRPDRREKLEQELQLPEFPKPIDYIWQAFHRIRRRVGEGPIGWPDIDAFVRHSRISLDPWEVEVIEGLDDLFVSAQNKAANSTEIE